MASTYGWPVAQVRALTDEQFVLVYLEPAQERRRRSARVEFENAVEAVRIGTIIARNRKALSKWNSSRRRDQKGKTGAALEHAVMSLQMRNPEYVVVG